MVGLCLRTRPGLHAQPAHPEDFEPVHRERRAIESESSWATKTPGAAPTARAQSLLNNEDSVVAVMTKRPDPRRQAKDAQMMRTRRRRRRRVAR